MSAPRNFRESKFNTMNTKNSFVGIFYAIAGGICWGFSGSCGEYLFKIHNLNSSWLCSVRIICAGLIMLGISLVKYRGELKKLICNKKDLFSTVLFGILGLLMSQYCYLTAISYSNAGTATVLQYLGPVFIMIFACLVGKRLPGVGETVALLLAVAGTFLIATHGNFGSLSISTGALVYGLLAALALVFYTLLPVRIIPQYGTMPVMGVGMIVGGLVLLPIARPWSYDVSLPFSGIAAFAAIVVVGTVLAFTLYIMGVEHAGAVKASVASSGEPVAAAVISAVWLGNNFLFADIVGFAAVIAAVIILSLSKKKVE